MADHSYDSGAFAPSPCRHGRRFCEEDCHASEVDEIRIEPTSIWTIPRVLDERDAWLRGFLDHRDGTQCSHGYGPGDHHWESGCIQINDEELPATRILTGGPIDCPSCGRPSWNSAINPGEPCLNCNGEAK